MRMTHVFSSLELAILAAIRNRPQSGYELRKVLSSSPLSLGDSPGAVYPALRRLAGQGLIESVEDQASARAKQTFHLTAAGKRAVHAAAAAPITAEEVATDPDRLLLRAALLDEPAQRAFLKEYARATADRAAELRDDRSLLGEYSAALYTARSKWATRRRN